MEEWKTYKIGEVADVQTGPFGSQLHNNDYVESGTPIVTVEHLGQRQFSTQNLPKVSDEDKIRLGKYVSKEGDIIFSRVGSVDRCSYVSANEDGWLFSGRCLRVRCNEGIDPLFVYYWFTLNSTKQEIRNIAVGATMPSINTKLLSELRISLPSLQRQRKISSLLSSIDDKIELNNRINHNLEEQARNIFLSYIEQDSTECYFSDMITIGSGGTPRTSESRFWNGKIPFFSPKDVSNSCFTLVTEKSITDDGLSNCNSNLYPENTTFITARGTVGKISLAGVPMAMNQSCFALTSRVHAPFFAYFLTERVVESLKKKANGAVFDAINSKDIAQELVNVPNKDVILHVEDMICPYMNSIKSKSIENIFLIETREALLPRLMSGQLNINEIDS